MKLSISWAAEEAPEREALVVDGEVFSYPELAVEVGRTIAWLRHRGVDRSTPRAAMAGSNSKPSLVLLLALVELGVPVLLIHPRSTAAERRRQLAETGTEIFLEPPEPGSLPAAAGRESGPGTVDVDRPLAIVRTSGTAGRPKYVVLSRRAFIAAAEASAANLGWRTGDRWLLSLPIAHVGGLSIVTRCLLARRTVVVETASRFDAAAITAVIVDRRVTLVSLVPTMLRRLLDLEGWRSPAHLRALLVGGAAASSELLARAADRRLPVLTTYGLTEACSQVATQRDGTVQRGELGCGRPVAGMEIRLRDGAIEIRGACLMDGYLGSEKESPFTADGWLRTGDLGEIDGAGNLHVLGRSDGVIVTGGENVHPLEVEQVLEDHPAITSACVFGVADDEWGQVVAAALAATEPLRDGELISFLTPRLAAFKRPRRIAYLDDLPRRSAGKLDRALAVRQAMSLLRPLVR
ncbi:MAG: AMP-binding protein [Thermoanaerobaculia bacterium]